MAPRTLAGKYELTRRLGAGAMGVVWAARNLLTQREVAIKLISKELTESDEARRRMLREAAACGRLSHPNIVQVLDVGTSDDGSPFLVMELLQGEPLADRLANGARLTTNEAASVALGIARALIHAHAAGVVHRDLKPANVFLHQDAHYGLVVKVVDFGISKELGRNDSTTMTGMAVGSPAYMSPEQARGDVRTLDHRSDLWSLGVVLFELLCGQRPFVGETAFAVVSEVLKGPIPRPSEVEPRIDPRLGALVERCLVRDVTARVASAAEVVAALEPVVGHESGALTASVRSSQRSSGEVAVAALASSGAAVTSTTPFHRPSLSKAPGPPASRSRTAVLWAAGALIGAAAAGLLFMVVTNPSEQQTPASTTSDTARAVGAARPVPDALSAEPDATPSPASAPLPSSSAVPEASASDAPATASTGKKQPGPRSNVVTAPAKPTASTKAAPATSAKGPVRFDDPG